jgi:spermidine synthase
MALSRRAMLVFLCIAAAAPAVAAEPGLLEKRESLYNNIFIFGDSDNVSMTFGQNKRYYTESNMKLSDPGALTVDYTRFMTLGVAYPPKLERIAEIGLGGGRTVSYLSASLPDTGILLRPRDIPGLTAPDEEPGIGR